MNELDDQINKKIKKVDSLFDDLLKDISLINGDNADIEEIKILLKDHKNKFNMVLSESFFHEEE